MSEKCDCGHVKKSHYSVFGVVGAGMRLYLDCKFCDCKQYKLEKKQGLEAEK